MTPLQIGAGIGLGVMAFGALVFGVGWVFKQMIDRDVPMWVVWGLYLVFVGACVGGFAYCAARWGQLLTH